MFTNNDVLIKKINDGKAICVVEKVTLKAHGISQEKLEHDHPSAKKIIQECVGMLIKNCFSTGDLLKFVTSCNKKGDLVIVAEKIDSETLTEIIENAEDGKIESETFDLAPEEGCKDEEQFSRVFACKDMSTVIRLAKALGRIYNGSCSLYSMKEQYYLVASGMTSEEYVNTAMLNNEFALSTAKASIAYYQEHGKLIVENSILKKLSQL